jgi:hypothetical protein
MPGGTFITQNKVRPGAYVNFKSVPRPLTSIGDRGIVAFPMALNWGASDKLIDIYSEDLLDGVITLAEIGMTAFDSETMLLNVALSFCHTARIYRTNGGGEKASANSGELRVTAIHDGTLGNDITVVVTGVEPSVFDVETFVRGTPRDLQRVTTIAELTDNRFVSFTSTGSGAGVLTPVELALAGGSNGTQTEEVAAQAFANLLSKSAFHTFAVPWDAATIKGTMSMFSKTQRDDEGRYIQGVVSNYSAADHEGTINVRNRITIEDTDLSWGDMTILASAVNAACPITESNTGRVIPGATQIIDNLTHAEIVAGLRSGQYIFSANQDGRIKVEQDINSLHTFTQEKGSDFRKNRIIRTLDESGTTVKALWENSYIGRVSNNENGRMILKADIVNIINERQAIGAYQDFGGAADVDVRQGNESDAVVCNLRVRPVDSMEFLYMTVNLS